QAALPGRSAEGVKPSSPGRIRLDKLYFLHEVGIASFEAAGKRRIQIRNGFEALDPSHRLAGFHQGARLDLEVHLDRLAQHPRRELGKADPPEVAVLPPK